VRSDDDIAKKLRQHNIPLDKPLLVSWGRAVPYKKFDIVIKSAAELGKDVHAVVVVSPESRDLSNLRNSLGLDMSLIFGFDAELVACLLQWKNSAVVPILAKLEPCGLTPMEARMHARHQGPLVVTSDTGGLPEQMKHGVDGLVSRQDDVADVVAAIRRILAMSDRDKQRIREAGFKRILRQYTWTSQIVTTLSSLLPHVALVGEELREECVREELASLK
jgi:glycosyltransferase involved in cell wall biosynthesis